MIKNATFEVLPAFYANPVHLRAALAPLSVLDGWVEYASGITARWGDRTWQSGDGASGFPIAGEWVDRTVSWALRGYEDGWVLVRMNRTGGESRVLQHTHLGDAAFGAEAPCLRYEVLWTAEPFGDPVVNVWTPTASRFAGFGPGEE